MTSPPLVLLAKNDLGSVEHLRLQHGYTHLDVQYLADTVGGQSRLTGELVAAGLARFSRSHPRIDTFVLTGEMPDAAVAELRNLLGDRLRLITGDNTVGSPERIWAAADRAAAAPMAEVRPTRRSGHQNVVREALDALDAIRATLEERGLWSGVRLLTAGGSAALGHYQPGWSDVDVVLVVGDDQTGRTVDALRPVVARSSGVSISVCAVSEIERLAIPPKIVFVLRLLQDGSIVAYHQAPGWHPPVARLVRDRAWAVAEMVVVVDRCRRYLQDDVLRRRAVYKYCTLLCRLLLRLAGPEPIAETAVLERFREVFACDALIPLEKDGSDVSADDLRSAALAFTEWFGHW